MQDIKGAIKHLKDHQIYPANKADLIASCNELSDFSESDKKWFSKNLPDGKYNSANEVIKALDLDRTGSFAYQSM